MREARLALVLSLLAVGLGAPACARDSDAAPPPTESHKVAAGTLSAENTLNFDDVEVGQLPPGFQPVLSGAGKTGVWQVQQATDAPTGDHVLAQTDADPTNDRYPLCIHEGLAARDIDVWVHLRPVSGGTDQAGGIVIRFQDKDNYYVVRANALEQNVRLYRMVGGKRIQFAGKDVEVKPNAWHVLKLSARGPHFEVSFNGSKLFEADDETIEEAGKVGLWTKADSVTQFDGFKLESYDKGR